MPPDKHLLLQRFSRQKTPRLSLTSKRISRIFSFCLETLNVQPGVSDINLGDIGGVLPLIS